MTSRAGLQMWRAGSLNWRPELAAPAAALRESLDGVDPEALDAALAREICRRLDAFLGGILAYRRHPYRRRLADPPTVWSEGPMRLLDYGACAAAARDGPPVLVVPSLINGAYILDLSERRSLLRYLAGRGLRPLLMDWGRPGRAERDLTLSDYIAGRLNSALDATLRLTGRRPAVLGYCMGGLLALALAARREDDVTALALLATPWDFHAGRSQQGRLAAAMLGPLTPLIDRFGELPVDALQAMFATLDPLGVARKFCALASLAQSAKARFADSEQAEDFVALEDWLNDGVPLVAPVAEECLGGWYGANEPGRGTWRVAGKPVRPAEVRLPALVVVPERDRIVPPESAEALAAALPNAERMATPLGHIGMIVSSRAEPLLWRPLADWLAAAAAPPGAKPRPAARRRAKSAKGAHFRRRSP
jgi:polyhydroxyalkanoate synthase